MTTTQRVDVERLSELLDKATPGPWRVVTGKNISVGPCPGKRVALCNYDNGPIEKANAALISEMHKALPALLQQLAERDAALRTVRDEYQSMARRWSDAESKLAERDAEIERLTEQVRQWGRSFAANVYVPNAEYAAMAEKANRAEAAERASDEATGLLREVLAWHGTVPIADKNGGIFGRIAAYLAANGGARED